MSVKVVARRREPSQHRAEILELACEDVNDETFLLHLAAHGEEACAAGAERYARDQASGRARFGEPLAGAPSGAGPLRSAERRVGWGARTRT